MFSIRLQCFPFVFNVFSSFSFFFFYSLHSSSIISVPFHSIQLGFKIDSRERRATAVPSLMCEEPKVSIAMKRSANASHVFQP
jgi:hypothetical protein